jgi:hypothetical protein
MVVSKKNNIMMMSKITFSVNGGFSILIGTIAPCPFAGSGT